MSDIIKEFCADLSGKLNKVVTYESDKMYPYIKNGDNYRILVDGSKTLLLLNELDLDVNNNESREELINIFLDVIINTINNKQGSDSSNYRGNLTSHKLIK